MVASVKKTNLTQTYGVGYSAIAQQIAYSTNFPITNPDAMGQLYREMVEMDETVSAGLEFLCFSVISKMGNYSHPDKRINDLVDSCVNSIHGTIEEGRRSILADAVSYGFGVSEFTLSAMDGRWVLSSLQNYDPAELQIRFEKAKDNSTVIRDFMQRSAGREIYIPAQKCYLHRHNAGTNPFGRSRLRRCWRWYSFKKVIPQLWAVALERFGMPILIGKSDDTDAMAKLLEGAYSTAFAAIGREDEILPLISTTGSSGIEGAYSAAAEFCNKMIYRSMFLPGLLEAGEGGGSYALGNIHWRMFDDACKWLAREMIETELEQLWRPIIDWNFGPQSEYGSIPLNTVNSPEENEMLSKIFTSGVNDGYLFPEEGDREWMRERLGFPEIEEGGEPSLWRSRLAKEEDTPLQKEGEPPIE